MSSWHNGQEGSLVSLGGRVGEMSRRGREGRREGEEGKREGQRRMQQRLVVEVLAE